MFLLLRLIVDVSPRMQRDGDRGMQQPNEVVRYFMIFFPPKSDEVQFQKACQLVSVIFWVQL